jgi:HAD superfamily hydrolase (TIGR01459 family)
MSAMPIEGLKVLAAEFDIFLVDQFGVLHDGSVAYPGAAAALRQLKRAGKTIVLLSNSGRRSGPNRERMDRLGFDPESYDSIISSGEVAWHLLATGALEGAPGPGAKCLLLARRDDTSAIDGLPFARTQSAAEADFIMLTGSDGDTRSMAEYQATLAGPATRRVPCICTNPDKILLTPHGESFGAGRIAELYEENGGPVFWVGKPHPEMYRFALAELGNPPCARIVAIGDSVEHDIVGAARFGFRTVLATCGIHAGSDDAALAALYERHGAVPDYVIPRFAWAWRE